MTTTTIPCSGTGTGEKIITRSSVNAKRIAWLKTKFQHFQGLFNFLSIFKDFPGLNNLQKKQGLSGNDKHPVQTSIARFVSVGTSRSGRWTISHHTHGHNNGWDGGTRSVRTSGGGRGPASNGPAHSSQHQNYFGAGLGCYF